MKRYDRNQPHWIELELNGRPRGGYAQPRTLLLDFLRHELGATGSHAGCEHGVCGACTVHIDGVAARSCLTLAVQTQGRRVDTVEGLAGSERLNDLQQAFRRHHALQCGFCTPGILMSCSHYLAVEPNPTEASVREMLSGHYCRCTGYTGIVQAVLDVAERRRVSTGQGDQHV